ncbi:nucleotidyltransferase domain-containing protein [Mucilaginibacter sp.]|uniref:nucleotidyltransferase family protein n=1 Tax=Mucilaginibacter sp. TaxID=1882438 RepID=UPI00262253EC|nr:nucleotidyltransferase domain-containing protein [Mucilaginibacter sp.]MDB4920893.1 polymerase subunit beta [Mucilaginibacter sp.]
MVINEINFESKEFIDLCRVHKVKELYAFGSVLTNNFTDKSDIDLIVEIDEPNPIFKGKLILSLYNKFETLFNKKVDLLTFNSIRNPILEEYIGTRKKLIYPLQ